MWRFAIAFGAFVVGGVLSLSVEADDYAWHARRAGLRSGRKELREFAEADRRQRAEDDAQIAHQLLDAAERERVPGQDYRLRMIVAQIGRLDPSTGARLTERLSKLKPEPTKASDRTIEAWESLVAESEAKMVARPGDLLNRAIELRLYDLAHEYLQEILAFAPDHSTLRKNLGQSLHQGRWLTAFEFKQAEQGLAWDERFGWHRVADLKRYENGEYFDLEKQIWTTLQEANAEHASIDNPWKIRTEHLEIGGTAELQTLAHVATRLETFYRQVFAAYAAFFARSNENYRLVLGMADHPPLLVRVFRDAEDLATAFPQRPKWSQGIFDANTQTSLFVPSSERVMHHEFTHQILHVFANGNRSPAWLTEGIAVYTQAPRYEQGQLMLGRIEDNVTLERHLTAFRQKRQMTLSELWEVKDLRIWGKAADPEPQYGAAGALVQFCMEGQGRAFRADFIDFLSDSYRGRAGSHELWDYLGLEKETLIEFYEDWLRRTARATQPVNPLVRKTSARLQKQLQRGLILSALMLLEGEAATGPQPVPDLAAQREALDVIRKEVHADEYKRATTRTAKLSLSDVLHREGVETLDDPAARYVLFREATTLACEGGDIDRALKYIDETARLYQIDALPMKFEAISTASKSAEANPARMAIATQSLKLMSDAATSNDYELARKLGELGKAAAEQLEHRGLQQQIQTRMREIDRIRDEYAGVKGAIEVLKKSPDDPAANLAVGKFHCFIHGDWATGLPMLLKGNDSTLRELATLEQAAPAEAAGQVKLGDGWWKLGRDAEEPTKTHAQVRAAFWYRAAVPKLSGLTKSKVQERLKQLEREGKSK